MRLLLLITTTLFATSVFAANMKINTSSSVVNWKGSKVYEVGDDHSGTVKIKADHKMNGKTLTSHIEADGNNITGGTIIIDMTSIQNADLGTAKMKKKLVGHLASPDFFDTANHKVAMFQINSAKKLKGGKYEFTGTMTIRGKSVKGQKLVATVTSMKGKMKAKGSMKIDRTKFGVEYSSQSVFPNLLKTAKEKIISNDIELSFQLETV